MRILAGDLKNRSIAAPKGVDVRPTGERVREAIFNILYARMDFDDLTVADICCGTGALGIEALSRGAAHCTFIDLDTKPATYNLKHYELMERCKIVRGVGQKAKLYRLADLVFVDPPYYQGIAEEVLKNYKNIGKKGALWIVEVESKHELEVNEEVFEQQECRKYGHSKVYIFEQLV